MEKRHTPKSHRDICGDFPTQPNLTKLGMLVVVADIINIPSLVMIGPGSTKLRRVEFWLAL